MAEAEKIKINAKNAGKTLPAFLMKNYANRLLILFKSFSCSWFQCGVSGR
ncbi:MAG TPA: hypothetical protein IAD23_05045 [Candidatus Scubalenecus merdavium]|uniref:Uncharacterized protein n=1 Tax=Candidatus Scybalenecus merdavium TaxID=2840939 RepID=A0A9D1MUK3_9FIRM|nr:hypothetical protein [Candidatus Scubalenecus merdavium]